MPDTVVPGPYNSPSVTYHNQGAAFNRVIRVTASTNNPFTLTGSYSNNSGFLIMNTASLSINTKDGTSFNGSDFHEPNQNHQIFPIGLSYVSASGTGDIAILYAS